MSSGPHPAPIRTVAQLQAALRQMRIAQGLSQAELGKRLGVQQERISRIESHPERMKVDQLLTLILALQGELLVKGPQAAGAATGVKEPPPPKVHW